MYEPCSTRRKALCVECVECVECGAFQKLAGGRLCAGCGGLGSSALHAQLATHQTMRALPVMSLGGNPCTLAPVSPVDDLTCQHNTVRLQYVYCMFHMYCMVCAPPVDFTMSCVCCVGCVLYVCVQVRLRSSTWRQRPWCGPLALTASTQQRTHPDPTRQQQSGTTR
jgi:hypothetical protein